MRVRSWARTVACLRARKGGLSVLNVFLIEAEGGAGPYAARAAHVRCSGRGAGGGRFTRRNARSHRQTQPGAWGAFTCTSQRRPRRFWFQIGDRSALLAVFH